MRRPSGEQIPVMRMPVSGIWWLPRTPGHHRYAFDLVAVDRRWHHALAVSRLSHLCGQATVYDAYSWGARVCAPAAGIVVQASDGWPDREHLQLLKDVAAMLSVGPKPAANDLRPFAGNYAIIDSRAGYVLLAHLRRGSLSVREGDRVDAGQPIGRVGNSGLTLEPHLHLQVFDRIDDLPHAATRSFRFEPHERWTRRGWACVRDAALRKGDIIRSLHADAA